MRDMRTKRKILNWKVLALAILLGMSLVLFVYTLELDLTMSLRHSAGLLDAHSSIDAQSVAKTANHFYSCRGVRFLIKVMDATNGAYGDVAAANLFEMHRVLGAKTPLSHEESEIMALLTQSDLRRKCDYYATASTREAIRSVLSAARDKPGE